MLVPLMAHRNEIADNDAVTVFSSICSVKDVEYKTLKKTTGR